MKSLSIVGLCALICICLTARAAEPVVLFDGKTLEGWEGNEKVWRVKDGAIVGGSMEGNLRSEFLATTKKYTNFVLKIEYKLTGTEGFVNGGVQIRSERVKNPPNEMSGYQADLGAGYSGALYDESRRNKVLAKPEPEDLKKIEKVGEWNSYEIRCEGTHVLLKLNGVVTVDYTEKEEGIAQTGFIGLQIHGGAKSEAAYRNISIEELPAK